MKQRETIFDYLYQPKKINKPIRLIELFAGVGSQAMALRDLGANFEHYRVVEFDRHAINSYNAIHGTDFEPMDITKIHAKDLNVVDTEKYEYIMTYSFPCQDLSIAGKQKGMTKGEGTRSGLLWEVERLLDELTRGGYELPQILLMENVPEVIGLKNIADFNSWQLKLEELGYQNYTEVLNAKDYGIPQNRRRCFMVSFLGGFVYQFPKRKPLNLRLKDLLEDEVDDKYYLSQYALGNMLEKNKRDIEKGNGFMFEPNEGDCIGKTIDCKPQRQTSNYVIIGDTQKEVVSDEEE